MESAGEGLPHPVQLTTAISKSKPILPKEKSHPQSVAEFMSKFCDATVGKPEEISVGKLKAGTRAEEFFLKICADLEAKERGGELPDKYSELTVEDVQKIRASLNDYDREIVTTNIEHYEKELIRIQNELENNLYTHESLDEISNYKKKLEEMQLVDTLLTLQEFQDQTIAVQDETNVINPLGKLEGKEFLVGLPADEHHVPDNPKTGIRSEAFETVKIYKLQRGMERVRNFFLKRKLAGKFKDSPEMENMAFHYLIQNDTRHLFNEWMPEVIEKYLSRFPEGERPALIMANGGDRVHDGADFEDQLTAIKKSAGVLSEIKKRVKDLEIYSMDIKGNHDQDSRIPESFGMLTALEGQQIFAQEIGGVLIASVDTNILNPEWRNQFTRRASRTDLELLVKKIQLQEKVLTYMQNFEGEIILRGHNPARLIEAYSVLTPIIQNSNIVRIIAHHTHDERHFILPKEIVNNKGQRIKMDVTHSYYSYGTSPEPPRLPVLRISNGHVGDIITLRERQEDFNRRFLALQNSKT